MHLFKVLTRVLVKPTSITPQFPLWRSEHILVPLLNLLLAFHPQAVSLLISGIIASWHFLELRTHEIIHYDWGRGPDLASFTQQISSVGHSLSLLNSILLYDYITISVSVDGHLVCIHFGAIINNTSECSATNVCVNMFHFSWVGRCLGVELLGYEGNDWLLFKKLFQKFPHPCQ